MSRDSDARAFSSPTAGLGVSEAPAAGAVTGGKARTCLDALARAGTSNGCRERKAGSYRTNVAKGDHNGFRSAREALFREQLEGSVEFHGDSSATLP